jgi:hypothetical protein
MAPVIDRLQAASAEPGMFDIAEGSTLADDDSHRGGYPPSHAATWCATTAIDHLHAVEMDTRSRIIVSAMQCFSRNGFAGTSLADIEAEAGFSVGADSTYRYFASKRAMLEAAVADALLGADE